MSFLRHYDDFFLLGNLPILSKNTGLSIYDFRFRDAFACRSVVEAVSQPVLLRIGAIPDFGGVATALGEMGMELLFTQQQHDRASFLENWYPLLASHTPASQVYDTFPSLAQLLADFSFPVFIKGSRQTNGHKRNQCIIENAAMYTALAQQWKRDKRLHWQKVAVREFVPLQIVDDTSYPEMVPFSYEFRVFYWKKQLVGYGRYWWLGRDYTLAKPDQEPALALAQKAADCLDVPFLAVDIAKTRQGEWIIIEVNDGQESGYAGVNPALLWQKIARLEGCVLP